MRTARLLSLLLIALVVGGLCAFLAHPIVFQAPKGATIEIQTTTDGSANGLRLAAWTGPDESLRHHELEGRVTAPGHLVFDLPEGLEIHRFCLIEPPGFGASLQSFAYRAPGIERVYQGERLEALLIDRPMRSPVQGSCAEGYSEQRHRLTSEALGPWLDSAWQCWGLIGVMGLVVWVLAWRARSQQAVLRRAMVGGMMMILLAPMNDYLTQTEARWSLVEGRPPRAWHQLREPSFAWLHRLGGLMEDRLPLRTRAHRLSARLRRGAGLPLLANNLIVGKEGWLFERIAGLDQYADKPFTLSEPESENLEARLDSLEAWAARFQVQVVVLLIPDKSVMCEEFLPDSLDIVRPGLRDRVLAASESREGFLTLDIEPALRQAGPCEALFLRDDTHWNERGAWVAYRLLMDALASRNKWIDPLLQPRPTFETLWVSDGNLARLAHLSDTPFDCERTTVVRTQTPVPLSWCFRPRTESEPIESARFLNQSAQGHLLMYHDSYWNAAMGWTARHFAQVDYLRSPFPSEERLRELAPQIVVVAVMDRFLPVWLEPMAHTTP